MATPFFNRYKIAHTLLGTSCTIYFETALGMNKITPKNKKNSKKFFKTFFYFNDILTNFFKEVGLATLSFNWYSMAQGLLGRSCFKYLNIMKNYPFPYPYLKKISKIPKIYFFVCDDIFLKKTPIPYPTIGKVC